MARVPALLAGLLGVEPANVKVRQEDGNGAVLVLVAGTTFVLSVNKSTGAGPVAAAVKKLQQRAAALGRRAIPLLVVPFLGEAGRRVCEEAGVGWLDLSGNAQILAPGLRVIIEGKPNRFKALGRPANLFAPKSSRLARWLLMNAGQPLSQRELAKATGLDEGFVSRLVARLAKDQYLGRNSSGEVFAKDPSLLLDAWHGAYQFEGHTHYRGVVAARSGDALLRFVAEILAKRGLAHAATGLAAAWAMTRFAAFRIATFYLPDDPSPGLLEELGFREDPLGGNLWLVVPNDPGVFHGAEDQRGIRCVHPVQVYLDLKGHPERATDAAQELRARLLNWGADG